MNHKNIYTNYFLCENFPIYYIPEKKQFVKMTL